MLQGSEYFGRWKPFDQITDTRWSFISTATSPHNTKQGLQPCASQNDGNGIFDAGTLGALQVARTALQVTRTALQVARTALQVARMALQVTRTALQVARTALQVPRTALQVTRTALQVARTALQVTRTALWPGRDTRLSLPGSPPKKVAIRGK